MTTPAQHPSETLLLEYAAGTLREPQALALATHLAFCPDCRRHATLLDGLGGALLDAIDPEPMPAGALPALLQRLDNAPALLKGGAASTRGFGKSAGRTGRAGTAAGLSRRSAGACGLDRAVRRRPFPPPASRLPSNGRRNSESGSRFFTGRAPTHEPGIDPGSPGSFFRGSRSRLGQGRKLRRRRSGGIRVRVSPRRRGGQRRLHNATGFWPGR